MYYRLKHFIFSSLLFIIWSVLLQSYCEAIPKPVKITLFHLNDTYHIAPVEVKLKINRDKEALVKRGGMSRVRAYVKAYQKNNPKIPVFVLHAGDMLSPSLLSWKEGLKGKQMVDVLNNLPLYIATFGNHEFDFGCKGLEKRVDESKFIWLTSNITFPDASSIFKKVKKIHIFESKGIKVGFFGLTIAFRADMPCHQYEGDKIVFMDPEKAAKQAVQALKEKDVDIIVGITHLNMSADKKIALENPDIDLIIGGHEHVPLTALVGRTLIRKAGTNAIDLGKVELTYFPSAQNSKPKIDKSWEFIPINDEILPDPELKKIVDKYQVRIDRYRTIIGNTKISLEARSVCIRTHETNTGNLVADVIRKEGKGNLALINGGAFRADKIITAGPITSADIFTLLPYDDKIVTIEIDGRTIIKALENGLVNWGSRKGRFPQVSGIKFRFHPDRPNYNKVIKNSVKVGGSPIQPDKNYKLSTIDFLTERGEIDGYTMLKGRKVSGEYRVLTDVLIEYIRSKKSISPILDQRIVIEGDDPFKNHKCGDPSQVY